jgi:proteasome assembly chaperone (PAC2) family protein
MNSIISRAFYLNGLIEGLGITNETKEGKAITELTNIVRDMAIEVEDLQRAQEEIEDFIDNMDEDLADVEDEIFENNDEDDVECFDVHVEDSSL